MSSLYKVGDILGAGKYSAKIIKVYENNNTYDYELWFNNKGLGVFTINDRQLFTEGWELISGVPSEDKKNNVSCIHDPVDVGFRFTKFVCRKCNEETKEKAG